MADGVHFTDREWKFFLAEIEAEKIFDADKAVRNARRLAALEERFEHGDFTECELPELDDGARNYFVEEIDRQREISGHVNLAKALSNARYLAKIDRNCENISSGKNCITFTDEVWEAFVNAQNLSP